MKSQGNGNNEIRQGAFSTQVIEENPYLQRSVDAQDFSDAINETGVSDYEDDEVAPTELDEGRRRAVRRRRRLAIAGLFLSLLLAIAGAFVLYSQTSIRVDYRGTRQSEVLPSPPNSTVATERDARTDKAIEEAQKLTGQATSSKLRNDETSITEPTANSKTILDTPFKVPTAANETPNLTGADLGMTLERTQGFQTKTESSSSAIPGETSQRGMRSERSSEVSLYMNSSTNHPVGNPRPPVRPVDQRSSTFAIKRSDSIVLPAFASMLPVRTVGALYTLRTGALVRLELTRETQGNGWSMKRGTILVGTSKGGESGPWVF